MIYFISNSHHIKIGVTENITKRLSQLQTGSSEKLEVLFTIEGSYIEESILHKHFQSNKIRGEWFNIEATEALKETVENILTEIESPSHIFTSDLLKLFSSSLSLPEIKLYCQLLLMYSTNTEFALIKTFKQILASKLNIKLGTLNNALSNLVKKGLLLSKSRNIFQLNSKYFYKGSIEN
jgi:hypothetical protein